MLQPPTELQNYLGSIAHGKVRHLYEIDPHTLFFVASDRISAFDVVLKNVSHKNTLYHNSKPNMSLGHTGERRYSQSALTVLVPSSEQ